MNSPHFAAALCIALPVAGSLRAPSAPVRAPQDDVPAEVTVEPLTETAYRLHAVGSGSGNTGLLLGDDGIVIVDGGSLFAGPDLEATMAGLYFDWRERTQGVAPPVESAEALPLRYVVNTHWHPDHTGTNPFFGIAGARVVAHETVRRRLMGDPEMGDKVFKEPMDAAGWPTITFEDALTLHLSGEEVRLLHFPLAHTDGDCVVWLPASKVAFLGDIYWSRSFPFIELNSGARPSGLLRALERLLEILPDDTKVVPGHGPATGIDELRAFHAMFADCDRQIRGVVGEEMTLRAVEDMKMFGEYEDYWGEGKRDRVKGFIEIMWYCYAPTRTKGLGELDKERERDAARTGESGASGS